MRYLHDDEELIGTPEELSEFFDLREMKANTNTQTATENAAEFPEGDFAPLENVVNESAKLRRELAKDPNYSPFPNVSPGPESDDSEPAPPVVTAEDDTGVELA